MSSKFALVIGNTDYQDASFAKLTAPGKDAEEFAQVLRDAELAAFDDVQVLINEGEGTTRRFIARFFTERKRDDLLLLYFSGHGVRNEQGLLFLAANDTEFNILEATGIPAEFVTHAMNNSRSQRQLLILDCCNSGAFAYGTKSVSGVGKSMGIATAFEGSGFGHVVITATDATQYAWEGEKVIGDTQKSVFTHFLIEGLRGEADSDGDSRITIDELYDYAFEQVVRRTPKQTPCKWSYKQQGDIILRENLRLRDVKPAPLPSDLLDLLSHPNSSVRKVGIQDLIGLLDGKRLGLARAAENKLREIAATDDSLTSRKTAADALNARGLTAEQSGPPPIEPPNEKKEEEKPIGPTDIKTELEKIASQAIQYELKGDFWNALQAYYKIKRIDPLFPRVDVKIKELERGELRPTYASLQTAQKPAKKAVIPSFRTQILTKILTLVVIVFIVFGILSRPIWLDKVLKELGIGAASAIAEVVLEFGGEGSGPGLFHWPCCIAVDKDGNIYIADFDTGRVQKFDPNGNPMWLRSMQPNEYGFNYIEAVAADFAGRVYLTHNGDIVKLSAEDGTELDIFPSQILNTRYAGYAGLAINANNIVYALHSSGVEVELIKLSPEGEILDRWENIVSGVSTDERAFRLDLATDGSGNIYISSELGKQVYIFDQNGKFIDRIGPEGDAPGSMRFPAAITVDGHGRIYVRDLEELLYLDGRFYPQLVDSRGRTYVRDLDRGQVVNRYDASGNYIDTIIGSDYYIGILDLAIDVEGNVYTITHNGIVRKFKLTAAE